MPKLNRITVTALNDTKVVTGVKKLAYRKIDGLPQGMPEGQEATYENTHAISLVAGQSLELDVTEAQMKNFQAAVDAGDIEVEVIETSVTSKQLTAAAAGGANVAAADLANSDSSSSYGKSKSK